VTAARTTLVIGVNGAGLRRFLEASDVGGDVAAAFRLALTETKRASFLKGFYARSNRSRFMTLFQAATKSLMNFACASSAA
jgi:hypothetical protein